MLCRLNTIVTITSATLLLSTAGCSLPGLFRSDDDVSNSDQGAELLNRTLTENPTVKWSGRLDADLAAAQLILGDLDEALESLHAVQQNYHLAGRWQVSLGHDITERDRIVPVSRAVHSRPASTSNRDGCDIQRFVR